MIELRWLVKKSKKLNDIYDRVDVVEKRVLQYRHGSHKHNWSEWQDVPEVEEE